MTKASGGFKFIRLRLFEKDKEHKEEEKEEEKERLVLVKRTPLINE